MTAIFQLALTDAVTVGEQERIERFIGNDFGGKARQHVRAVQVPGNVAEAFGFTLRAQRHARLVEPFQRRIGGRADLIDDAQRKAFRQVVDDQLVAFFFIV